ncbi:MAG: helix-turn-helix transcriptional regulator [Gemmatimonadetes bacterium]|nr:helix-turn-helix transcriptional regulator [Gemmatimonadota bacterium]
MIVGRGSDSPGRHTVSRTTDDPSVIEDLLPLSPPVYYILLALGVDTLHGYAIMQAFDGLMGGTERLLPGTLYATLARMMETGLIEEAPPPEFEGDPRRRYYSVTEFGRVAAAGESERLRRLLEVAVAQNLAPGRTG